MNHQPHWEQTPMEISDKDIMEAMRAMEGYIDITPGDFREVFKVAYPIAMNRLLTGQTARDMMTKPVLVVPDDMGLIQTAGMLAEKGISGAPVVDSSGVVIGVISEKDFAKHLGAGEAATLMKVIWKCLESNGCGAISMKNQKAKDIMTAPATTAPEDTSIGELSSLFSKKSINRIPIVNNEGRPVGIVTRADMLASYCRIG